MSAEFMRNRKRDNDGNKSRTLLFPKKFCILEIYESFDNKVQEKTAMLNKFYYFRKPFCVDLLWYDFYTIVRHPHWKHFTILNCTSFLYLILY